MAWSKHVASRFRSDPTPHRTLNHTSPPHPFTLPSRLLSRHLSSPVPSRTSLAPFASRIPPPQISKFASPICNMQGALYYRLMHELNTSIHSSISPSEGQRNVYVRRGVNTKKPFFCWPAGLSSAVTEWICARPKDPCAPPGVATPAYTRTQSCTYIQIRRQVHMHACMHACRHMCMRTQRAARIPSCEQAQNAEQLGQGGNQAGQLTFSLPSFSLA